MGFRLTQAEQVAAGIKRLAAEQLDRAIAELEDDSGDHEVQVHEARKCLKRLRAVARLARVDLGDQVFRLENGCYRDAARQLAGLRDATALLEALAGLTAYAGKRIRRRKFTTVEKWLVERRDAAHGPQPGMEQVRQRVLNDLRWARRRVDEWPLEHTSGKALRNGIRRVYARGRQESERALLTSEDGTFHEWRKWVKYLWYHVQIIRDAWPAMMSALAGELDVLGDVLGQDHDLTVLRQTIMTEMSRPIRASTLQTLLELIDDRQGNLRERAQRLGRRLYLERPQDFARRIQGYWSVWRAEMPTPEVVRSAPSPSHSTEPELVADYACHTGEGPLWHPLERRLYWIDIPTGRLFRYEPVRGTHEQCFRASEAIGGFTIQADGALLLFMARGAVGIWRQGHFEHLIQELEAVRQTRFNDVIADPAGRVFCGTMPGPGHAARLYQLELDGSLGQVLDDVGLANGMGFAPDRRTFYFTDSRRSLIRQFDYDEKTGLISRPRVFVDVASEPGVPDGLTVDSEGCVWSARWDGGCVVRYSPAGEELERLELPAPKVSSVTFGGEGAREMYVTTAGGQDKDSDGAGAGGLFRIRVAVPGLPEYLSRIGP